MEAAAAERTKAGSLTKRERVGAVLFVGALACAMGLIAAIATKMLPIYRDLGRPVPLLGQHPWIAGLAFAACVTGVWLWSRLPQRWRCFGPPLVALVVLALVLGVPGHFFMPLIGTIENIGPDPTAAATSPTSAPTPAPASTPR